MSKETPRRGQKPRRSWVGYWLRRPEPSTVIAAIFASVFLVLAIVLNDWAPLIGLLLCVLAGLFVWTSRGTSRRNADRWRQRYDDVF